MKIGFLWPADGLNEAEYLHFLPDRLNFHVQRFDAGTDTEDLVVEVLSAYADPGNLASAASKLSKIKPDKRIEQRINKFSEMGVING